MGSDEHHVTVGDRMRFSTELLRQIHDQPEHRSPLVEIERIVRLGDGTLELWLKNVVEAPANVTSGTGRGDGASAVATSPPAGVVPSQSGDSGQTDVPLPFEETAF